MNLPTTRIVMLSVCVLLSLAGGVRAQGTFGMLPDPISTRELMSYADRLRLSPQQRSAAQAMHDQYKAEFRQLRETDIAAFMKDMRAMNTAGMLPKREAVQAFIKSMEQVNTKINTLDNRLLDQIQTVLAPEQSGMMARVRLARQRNRHSGSQLMWFTGNRPVDLSEIALDLDWSLEEQQAADPLLASYESKLTAAMKRLHESSTTMITDMFDAMERQGFADQDMEDPEVLKKLEESMQTMWQQVTKKALAITTEISGINQRAYRSVAAVLEPETARTFRDRYYTRAYPEAAFALSASDLPFREALKIEALTVEQREALVAAQAQTRDTMDRIVEDAVALIEESRKEFSPFDFDSDTMQQMHNKLAEMQQKVQQIQQGAIDSVRALLGPEVADKIATAVAASAKEAAEKAASVYANAMGGAHAEIEVPNEGEEQDQAEDNHWMGDHLLPGPIGKRELADYAATLKLTDDQKMLVEQLHQGYREKFQAVANGEIAAAQVAASNMWNYDAATQTAHGPTEQGIEQADRARAAAMEAIARADDEFFADVELALENDQVARLQRVRLARQRQCFNRHQAMGYYWGGSSESAIDLASLVRRQKLDADALAKLDSELAKYEQAVTPAFRNRYEIALKMNAASMRWQAEVSAARQDDEASMVALSKRYQEIMGESTRQLGEASAVIATLNRQTLESLEPLLPADAAYALRADFNRSAFPSVYNDQLAVERQLNEAMKLPDLGEPQRRTLAELAESYRPAYASLCDQLIAASSGDDYMSMMAGDQESAQKFMDRQEKMSKLHFDRTELNQRAIAQLRAALNEDQIKRIGGLPEPPEVLEFQMY